MADTKVLPVAFLVMPFRKRAVVNPPEGAPPEVDFDSLWDRAFQPALEELGYLAVRADIEAGTVILKDMLERLAFANLVLADLTMPNGNVYYEVGISHVAKETGCVLIAADWSRQLFDVDQMRTVRYPLKDGTLPEHEAQAIKGILLAQIPKSSNSTSPYHELVREKDKSTVFRDQVETISSFQADVKAVRLETDAESRRSKVRQLLGRYQGSRSLEMPEVGFELLGLVRDNLSWEELLTYADNILPPPLRNHAFTREQTSLARSKLGEHEKAIAGLQELARLEGETPERCGLMGGSYKRLWRDKRDERRKSGKNVPDIREQGYLDDAIESYRRGMLLDLNEYYCISNLPGLLRLRGEAGDAEEAALLDKFTVLTTQRKIDRGEDDGWARPTLLGAAFRDGDVARIKQLAREVVREGPAVWQLESTLQDISDTVDAYPDPKVKEQLAAYRDQLAALVG